MDAENRSNEELGLADDEARVADDPEALAAAEREVDAMPPEGSAREATEPPQDVVPLGSWSWEESFLIEGRLREEGIDAWVDRDNVAREEGTAVRTLVTVFVPNERAHEAAAIVRQADEGREPDEGSPAGSVSAP